MSQGRIIDITTGEEIQRSHSKFLGGEFQIPTSPLHATLRPRLLEQLDKGLNYKFITVSAPAGYGKTTLVAQWLRDRSIPALWLSLDQADNASIRFWELLGLGSAKMLAELNRETKNLKVTDFSSLDSVHCLFQEMISRSHQAFYLVIDNYQVITERIIHQELATLVEYLPQTIHLTLISRGLMPSELAALGGKGYHKELNVEQLSFSKGEIGTFFSERRIKLNGNETSKLKALTGGWVVGLEAAASFLESQQEDSCGSVESINWNNASLRAYFKEQVIGEISLNIQEFLLRTSILEELDEVLCNIMTGRDDGNKVLDLLYQTGILLLTGNKQGYRYHPLLKGYLYDLLKQRYNNQLNLLHRTAGHWYLENRFFDKAVKHSLQASDYDLALTIIEKHGVNMLRQGNTETLLYFSRNMPVGQNDYKLEVNIVIAWAYALNYRMQEAEQWLSKAEKLCNHTKDKALSEKDCHSIKGEIALVRVKIHTYDLEKMFSLIREASQYLPEGSSIVGKGMMFNNHLRFLLRVKKLYAPGKLDDIRKTITEFNTWLERLGSGALAGWITCLNGEIAYELNTIEKAKHLLLQGINSSEKSGEIGMLVPGLLNLVRIRWLEKDKNFAFELLAETRKKAQILRDPNWIPIIEAFRIRLLIEEGKREVPTEWLEKNQFTIYDELCLAKEYEYITMARVLITLDQYNRAQYLLERLLIQAEEENVYFSVIEILNLRAIVYYKQERENEALKSLKRALDLGQKDCLLRAFLDEDELLLGLIETLESTILRQNGQSGSEDNKLLEYIRKLLREGNKNQHSKEEFICVEELTLRENQLLCLISDGLSNHEIASTLRISMPTVKSHLRNIFQKFQVKNRTQAVAKGRALRIL